MPKRDFLTLLDMSGPELRDLLDLAARLKAEHRAGRLRRDMEGRILAMIFHKPSLRTRVSFESGMTRLGGSALYISNQEIGLGSRETVADIGRVLSRYVDLLMIRTFAHARAEELAAHATVPVINGLTDSFHPCQILADLLTVAEHLGTIEGKTVAYLGDGNNVARSWLNAARRLPVHLVFCGPSGYEPDAAFLEQARAEAGDRVRVVHRPEEAVEGAHVLYTDVWASMGQESEAEARRQVFRPYQINAALLSRADPGAIVLHCLPAHRGEEITDEVIEGRQSRVFDEAENRMHAQNALMLRLLGKA
jgi:ornithine carbamoyltransferase